jgi:hypothetical protein
MVVHVEIKLKDREPPLWLVTVMTSFVRCWIRAGFALDSRWIPAGFVKISVTANCFPNRSISLALHNLGREEACQSSYLSDDGYIADSRLVVAAAATSDTVVVAETSDTVVADVSIPEIDSVVAATKRSLVLLASCLGLLGLLAHFALNLN